MNDVFAIAIHGGAGDESKPQTEEEKERYREGLRRALSRALEILKDGGRSLDAVEAAVACLEDDPLFNAGHGAAFAEDGRHYLDSGIMDGGELQGASVCGLTTVKNPVRLARLVIEKSQMVAFYGEGAEKFADQMGVERVENSSFDDPIRRKQWEKKRQEEKPGGSSTVGAVALDRHGHLAGATSTGGLTNAPLGRMSDTAVVSAGTYASDQTCAVSCTGTGEQFIRYGVAQDIHARMIYGGQTLQQAAEEVVCGKLEKGDGGIIGVDKDGRIAIVFNTENMFRGAADHTGRYEVAL